MVRGSKQTVRWREPFREAMATTTLRCSRDVDTGLIKHSLSTLCLLTYWLKVEYIITDDIVGRRFLLGVSSRLNTISFNEINLVFKDVTRLCRRCLWTFNSFNFALMCKWNWVVDWPVIQTSKLSRTMIFFFYLALLLYSIIDTILLILKIALQLIQSNIRVFVSRYTKAFLYWKENKNDFSISNQGRLN